MKSLIKFVFTLVIAFPLWTATCQENQSWSITNPVFEKGKPGSFDELSVKDPSIVFYENAWHLFYTARGNNEYTTGYVSAKELKDLNTAPRFELKQIRGKSRYGCAPQVFYFSPQKKWYLIYQNRDSNYNRYFQPIEKLQNLNFGLRIKTLFKKTQMESG